MLEERKYTIAEMREIMGTQGRQGIRRRLQSYEVKFKESGRGDSVIYDIKKITDKFKVFCIVDLGFPSQTDFKKLKYFMYYFFCDETFAQIPDEAKEAKLREDDRNISRQTVSNYIERLNRLNLISTRTDNYVYYFARGGNRRAATKEEYNKAWHEYWERKNMEWCSEQAILAMCCDYGGVAKKYPIPEWNGIFMKEIHYIIDLVSESIENEIAEQI